MGILAMIAGLALLIVIHEFGHWIVARLLGFQTPVFSVGFGKPYLVLGRLWNTEFRLTPWLLGGYVAIPELGDESTAKDMAKVLGVDESQFKYEFKPVWKRFLVAVAGVTMNVIFALVVTFALLASFGRPYFETTEVFVGDLDPKVTIARDAGIQPKDVIVAVDAQPVKSPQELVKLVSAHKGTPAVLTLKRGGQTFDVTVTPNQDGRIGIAIGVNQELRFEKMSVGQAAVGSALYSWELGKLMVNGIGMMIGIVEKPAGLPDGATDVHGVIAIVQLGAQAYNMGLFFFLDFLVRISMMLAVMNILPIPVLDGGHVLFMAIEKVRGKPVSRPVREKVSYIFFALLIGLMVYALFNDIVNPVDFGK